MKRVKTMVRARDAGGPTCYGASWARLWGPLPLLSSSSPPSPPTLKTRADGWEPESRRGSVVWICIYVLKYKATRRHAGGIGNMHPGQVAFLRGATSPTSTCLWAPLGPPLPCGPDRAVPETCRRHLAEVASSVLFRTSAPSSSARWQSQQPAGRASSTCRRQLACSPPVRRTSGSWIVPAAPGSTAELSPQASGPAPRAGRW